MLKENKLVGGSPSEEITSAEARRRPEGDSGSRA